MNQPATTRDTAAPAEPGSNTELRQTLKDAGQSAVKKYVALTVGRPGLWSLAKYELLTSLLGPLPGALGLFLRQKLYPRLLGACGRGVVIGRNVTLRHPQRIALGDGVIIDDGCVLDAKGEDDRTIELGPGSILGRNTILSCKGGRIVLDRDVNISVNCTLISETSLHIGEKTLLAGHCYLIAGGNHGLERTDVAPVDQPYYEKGGIDIARHGWLGAGVRVLDGVRMGQGAVAAAGAVVHQSVPEFAIVGGVPAKVIRNRKAATGDSGSPDRDPQGED